MKQGFLSQILIFALFVAAVRLFGLNLARGRLLKIADSESDASANIDELSRMVPPVPLKLDEITPIVQTVAASNGLTIESQDSGLNVIDFHLTRKSGRFLNLILNKESDELVHLSVSSDKDEVLSESQFSTFGANHNDIKGILDSTIKTANQAQEEERKLAVIETLTADNFDAEILTPSGVKEDWEAVTKEDKSFELSLKADPSRPKVHIKFNEKDGKKGLSFDDRVASSPTLTNHLYVYFGLSEKVDSEQLIANVKSKLDMYKSRQSLSAKPAVSAEAIITFAKSLFSGFSNIKDTYTNEAKGSYFYQVMDQKGEKSTFGAISVTLLKKDLYELKITLFSRVLTIFIDANRFEGQKDTIRREFTKTFSGVLSASLEMEKIVNAIARKMTVICGRDSELAFEPKSTTSFAYLSTKQSEEGACLFLRSNILLTFHHFELFGKLDYVHVYLVNPMVQTELTFQPDPANLDQSVADFVLDLYAELNDAKSFFEHPLTENVKVDTPKAQEVVKSKGFKDGPDGTLEFENENGKVILRLKESDEYLSVNIESKKTTVKPGESFNSSKEIWIPKGSTANEEKRLLGIVNAAIKDLQK